MPSRPSFVAKPMPQHGATCNERAHPVHIIARLAPVSRGRRCCSRLSDIKLEHLSPRMGAFLCLPSWHVLPAGAMFVSKLLANRCPRLTNCGATGRPLAHPTLPQRTAGDCLAGYSRTLWVAMGRCQGQALVVGSFTVRTGSYCGSHQDWHTNSDPQTNVVGQWSNDRSYGNTEGDACTG